MRLAQSVIASLYPRGTSLLAPGPSHKMLGISAAGSRFAHARITLQVPGAQGRIRTFVPRKEGQIYSLLALTTHPPVQTSRPARRMMQQRGSPNKQIRVRAKIHLHANTTLGKIPYGVLLGKIRYAAAPRKKRSVFRNRSCD